jgi:hypothetical protein
MLKDDLNEIRNEVMRRTKSHQIKRRFKQEARKHSVQPTLRQEPDKQPILKEKFTAYIQNLVTKTNSSSININTTNKTNRNSLLMPI